MSDAPADVERRVRELMDVGERLRGALVVDETSEGYYVLTIRDWPHPDVDDADVLAERYAYLTKDPASGSDGWVTSGDAVAVNRRDSGPAGQLAGELATVYAQVAAAQRGGTDDEEPEIVDLVGGR